MYKKYILLTFILIIFLLNINIVLSSVTDASVIFYTKIFVSVFPFIILSNILIYFNYHLFLNKIFKKPLNKLFNISSSSIIFILSILSSMPSNSIYTKNLLDNKLININEANKILTFTYFPSISFMIGTVGYKMFNNIKIGIIILLSNYIYNILIGIYLRKDKINFTLENKNSINKTSFFDMLTNTILNAFKTCAIILGNLIIFIIIINILNKYLNINNTLLSILSGLLELTTGSNMLSLLDININLKIALTSLIINFSGLSILVQSKSILNDYNINIKRILIIKLIFSIIISILLYIFLYYSALYS